MTPREMWERMMDAKSCSYKEMLSGKNPVFLQAYATLLKDAQVLEERLPPRIARRAKRSRRKEKSSLPQFPGKMMEVWKLVPAGTRVRVVMASRFGDVGLTQNLRSNMGYEFRVPIDDMEDPWLGDISDLFDAHGIVPSSE